MAIPSNQPESTAGGEVSHYVSLLTDRYSTDNFLPLGLSPGPKSPVDLDSFLVPFIEELKQLGNGVPAYDAYTKTAFLLKAHLVLVSGDTPAVSKLVHLSGHVAKLPCRACKLEGSPYKIAFKFQRSGKDGQKTQYYYPLEPPNRFPADFPASEKAIYRQCKSYISLNLPLRSPGEYRRDGETSLQDPRKATASGVKGVSPFVALPTILIPYSCPFDVMHLVFLGFVRDLCALLNGSFFKAQHLNEHAARITKVDWETLGLDMSKIEAPSSYGRDPRDIAKYIKSFKAEELSNFLIHYLLPLSFQRVCGTTYRALQHLVLAISLATSYQIEDAELDEIDLHLNSFTEWYYATFYRGEYERLPACKYTVHALLHLAREVRNWGSASYFWQYAEVSCPGSMHC